jgi:hypothetical protein
MSVKIAVFYLNPSREIAVYFVPMEVFHARQFSREQILVVRLRVAKFITHGISSPAVRILLPRKQTL